MTSASALLCGERAGTLERHVWIVRRQPLQWCSQVSLYFGPNTSSCSLSCNALCSIQPLFCVALVSLHILLYQLKPTDNDPVPILLS